MTEPVRKNYSIYEDDNAVLVALSALLNSEVAAMQAANECRADAGNAPAYDEVAFYAAGDKLRIYLKSLEIKND